MTRTKVDWKQLVDKFNDACARSIVLCKDSIECLFQRGQSIRRCIGERTNLDEGMNDFCISDSGHA